MESKSKLKNKPKIICNIAFTRYEVVKHVCSKLLGWKLTADEKNEKWDLLWTDTAVPPEKLAKMHQYQKINHFPGMYSISRKNYLAMNLSKLKKKFPKDYNFFPKTWLYPCDASEIKNFLQVNKKAFVICKPEASCQGRGIFITKKIESVDVGMKYVVQEYMKKPFLIDNLKFDLRIYVLVTGCDPLRIFVHEEGLTRFATEEYVTPTLSNIDEMCMHLTNYAVNKNNPNFIHNEDSECESVGHKRSLKFTYDYLASKGYNIDELKEQIDHAIIKTLCSVQPTLSHHYKSCQPEDLSNSMCFEILGFDVILDYKARPFVLEVNHTPSFTTDSPLDRKIKRKVIKDALILLNLSPKNRKLFLKKQKETFTKLAICGKLPKEPAESKQSRLLDLQKKRDIWETHHPGQYRKIFPTNSPEPFQKFLIFANSLYQDMTGARLIRSQKPPKTQKHKLTVRTEPEARPRCNSIPPVVSPAEEKTVSTIVERLSKPIIKKYKSSKSPILPPLVYFDGEKLNINTYSTRTHQKKVETRKLSTFNIDFKPPRAFNFQACKPFDE